MEPFITGIHHLSAVSGDTQEIYNFYGPLLGMQLVKKTVNFDDPSVYHLYFGDGTGTPGSIFTSFPYGNGLAQGRHGKGKINTTAFSLPFDSLDYWQQRLDKYQINYKAPQQRSVGEVFIYLEDPDGLGLELVFDVKETRPGTGLYSNIPIQHTIRGIHHAEIWLEHFEKTASLLTTVMNHRLLQEHAGRFRYGVADRPGKYIDILWDMEGLRGLSGRGMIHHLAFATPDEASLVVLMEKLRSFGLKTTEIKNRKYFSSVYFTEPGGVIFEIATGSPGFTADENPGALGQQLQLPPELEDRRAALEKALPKINANPEKFN